MKVPHVDKCSGSWKKMSPQETDCEFIKGLHKLHPQHTTWQCRAGSCQMGGEEEIYSDSVI